MPVSLMLESTLLQTLLMMDKWSLGPIAEVQSPILGSSWDRQEASFSAVAFDPHQPGRLWLSG